MDKFGCWVAAIVALVVSLSVGARAEDDPRTRTDIDSELAQQLYRESQARQACKAKICEITRSKTAQGDNVACKVLKTWPAVNLKEKILKDKLDWPWGNAQCEASLALDRSLIVAAVSQPKYEAKIGKHEVECRLAAKDGKDTQTIKFSIDPVVTFENGKAIKAALHWGNVSGSASAKTALWSATAVDNAFNVLQGAVLEQINEFFGPKCDAATSNP